MTHEEKLRLILKGQIWLEIIREEKKKLEDKEKRIVTWLKKHKANHVLFDSTKCLVTDQEYTHEFENLWKLYPARNGLKAEKKASFTRFKNVKNLDFETLTKAVYNYSKSCEVKHRGIVRDMVRFLKDDYWPQWVTPSEVMLQCRCTGKDKKQQPSNIDQAVEDAINAARK